MQKRVNQFFKQIGLLATIGSSKGKLLHMRGVQKKKLRGIDRLLPKVALLLLQDQDEFSQVKNRACSKGDGHSRRTTCCIANEF